MLIKFKQPLTLPNWFITDVFGTYSIYYHEIYNTFLQEYYVKFTVCMHNTNETLAIAPSNLQISLSGPGRGITIANMLKRIRKTK